MIFIKKIIILAIILISVALASCLTSSQSTEKSNREGSNPGEFQSPGDPPEPSFSEKEQDSDNAIQKVDPEGPSISLSKEIIDINNNGQLDNGEKVKITYGAFDPDGINGIKLKLDGFGIENRHKEGTYSFVTDPLSSGTHIIKVSAVDSKGVENSQKIVLFVNGTGPSIYFPMQKFIKKEGENFNIVLSATNPIGNPKMNVQLTIKPLSNEIQVYEEIWCKSMAGMCTGAFEVEPGDTRAVSISMKAGKAGKYKISSDVIYRFEGDNRSTIPTNYLLTVIVEPE